LIKREEDRATGPRSRRVQNNDDCSGPPPADPGIMSAIGRPLVVRVRGLERRTSSYEPGAPIDN